MSRIASRRAPSFVNLGAITPRWRGPSEWSVRHMRSVRSSIRFGFLASTALALILTASSATHATPPNHGATQTPAPRAYSTPGSMPKPSSPVRPTEDGIRFRGSLPSSGDLIAPRQETATPLAPASNPVSAPASNEVRAEPAAKPPVPAAPAEEARFGSPAVTKTMTSPARAQAEPEPAAKIAPTPAPAAAPAPTSEPLARQVTEPAPAPVARPRSGC